MELVVLVGACLFAALWVVALMDAARQRPCPYCRKRIDREASKCPHCQSEVTPQLGRADREIQARRAADDAAREAAERDRLKVIG